MWKGSKRKLRCCSDSSNSCFLLLRHVTSQRSSCRRLQCSRTCSCKEGLLQLFCCKVACSRGVWVCKASNKRDLLKQRCVRVLSTLSLLLPFTTEVLLAFTTEFLLASAKEALLAEDLMLVLTCLALTSTLVAVVKEACMMWPMKRLSTFTLTPPAVLTNTFESLDVSATASVPQSTPPPPMSSPLLYSSSLSSSPLSFPPSSSLAWSSVRMPMRTLMGKKVCLSA